MNQQNKALFHEFPLTTVGDWEARIREDLKGADYEKKLIWKTLDNIKVKPYYTAEDLIDLPYLDNVPGQFPFVRGSKPFRNSWEVRQDFRVREVKDTVRKISLAVERGVTAPGFDFSNLQEPEFATFKLLLGSFVTLPVSLNFVPGPFAAEMAEYLLRLAEEMHVDPSDMRGSLGFDPLGHFSATGSFYASLEEDFKKADQLLLIGENEIPGFRLLAVNSTFLGGCGASVIQELAFGLSMASEYLTRLTGSGHSVKEVAERLQWNLGVGPDYFIEIAKIRAARLLFSALLSAYEADDAQKPAVFVHSITSLWNKTVFDPNVNMLRLTTEAMAAVLGGCDSLLVQPFDTCFREPNDFSERMARNIQIILREESYFDKVADPAAGSYYIDALTYAIAEHAWKLFLQTDEKGGYIKAFT
jgi:methylmalonyl-CoA mutase